MTQPEPWGRGGENPASGSELPTAAWRGSSLPGWRDRALPRGRLCLQLTPGSCCVLCVTLVEGDAEAWVKLRLLHAVPRQASSPGFWVLMATAELRQPPTGSSAPPQALLGCSAASPAARRTSQAPTCMSGPGSLRSCEGRTVTKRHPGTCPTPACGSTVNTKPLLFACALTLGSVRNTSQLNVLLQIAALIGLAEFN